MKISNFIFRSLMLTSLFAFSLNAKASAIDGKTVGRITEYTVTVDEKCSWNDNKSGEAIHALQEGQVIVNYEKIDSSTWEGSGFDTDVTPAKYSYSSYSKSIAEYENLILNAEASGDGEEYKGRLEQELNSLREAASKLETSHSTFAIDWRCKGSGNAFDQKRGKVYASYKVSVMFLPSPPVIEKYLTSGGTSVLSTETTKQSIDTAGDLYWYSHDGWKDGSERWRRKKVGSGGWQAYKSVFATSNGIVYAIDTAGDLYWYSHDGWKDGSERWRRKKVGSGGWQAYKSVFATSNGIVFGVNP